MSIFGVKRKDVDTSALKQEISNIKSQTSSQINDLRSNIQDFKNGS